MKYGNWLNEWLHSFVGPAVKQSTYDKYAQRIRLYLLPGLGDYDLSALTVERLQRFTLQLSERLSPNTVNAVISIMKSSLGKAVAVGVTKKQNSDGICRPRMRERKVPCLSITEQRKIERHIVEQNSPRLFGVVFCLYTGLRIGELLALQWEDIDLVKGQVSVNKTCRDSWRNGRYIKIIDTPKTESSARIIPVPRQLLPRLKAMKRQSGGKYFIEGREENGVQTRAYQKSYERLLQRLNIPHRSFHSLRHTFATRALECGMDVRTLSELLGHTDPTVTLKRYAHSLMEHKTDMMNRLGKLFTE